LKTSADFSIIFSIQIDCTEENLKISVEVIELVNVKIAEATIEAMNRVPYFCIDAEYGVIAMVKYV